jgi:uncharacterized protein (DUF2141 family)
MKMARFSDSSTGMLARAGLVVSVLILGVGAAPPTPVGTLTIVVGNVRNSSGRVHADICTEAQFLKDCPIAADGPAVRGVSTITVTNLPAGRFAAQLFHDENGNKQVDRAIFGIPKEGVGFSNNAKIRFSPPKFADAVFVTNGTDQQIKLNMRYFLGAKGPK